MADYTEVLYQEPQSTSPSSKDFSWKIPPEVQRGRDAYAKRLIEAEPKFYRGESIPFPKFREVTPKERKKKDHLSEAGDNPAIQSVDTGYKEVPYTEVPYKEQEDHSPSLDKFTNKSFMGRVGDVVGGMVEPLGGMVLGIPNFIESTARKGIQYGKEAFSKEGITPETEQRAQEAAGKSVIPSYTPKTETGKLGTEGLGNIMSWITGGAGEAVRYQEEVRRILAKQAPLTADEKKVIENVTGLGVEGLMAAAPIHSGVAAFRNRPKPALPPEPPKPEPFVDTTKLNQTELPFGEERIPTKAPYNVLPEEFRKQLEAELNPPVDQRVQGQGELFTNERPYQQGELLQGRPATLEGEGMSPRSRPTPPDITLPANDMRAGDPTGRQGSPFEMMPKAEEVAPPLRESGLLDFRPKMAAEEGLPYEKTQPEVRVPETPRPVESIPYTPQGSLFKGPGGKQRGVIDKDLLTLGTSALLEKIGNSATLQKFRGTFGPKAMAELNRAYEKSSSRDLVAVLSPDDFLNLATKRSPSYLSGKDRPHYNAEIKRGSVREGLKTEAGLHDAPYLFVQILKGERGELVGQVTAHEGRHRMDVFKEQGMDKIPVRLRIEAESPGLEGFSWDWKPKFQRGELKLSKLIDQESNYRAFRKDNSYEAFSAENPQILTLDKPVNGFLGGPGAYQRGFIGFKKNAQKQGLVPALLKYKKDFEKDLRPATDMAKAAMEQNAQDISTTVQGLGRAAIPKQMAILTKNPIIKWAVDHISEIESKVTTSVRDLLEGTAVEKNKRGFDRQVPSEQGALTFFRRYYNRGESLRAEMREMKDIWIDNIGKERLTRDSFKTDRQWETYSAMRGGLDTIRTQVNKARVASGLKPFDYVTNYFPSIWEGDYRVFVRDQSGKLIHAASAKTKWEAKKIEKAFAEKVPEGHSVNWEPISKGKYDISDVSAFEEAANIMAREGNTALAAEFNKIYANIASHRGAGKHGLQKTGVEGFMGTEKGNYGLKKMEEAYENYANKGYRYIGNLEKAQLQKELAGLPPEFRSKMGNSIEISQSFIDQAKGRQKEDIVKSFLGWIGQETGIGRNAAERLLSNANSLVLPYLLLTGKQVIANATQPFVNLAQLSRLKDLGETSKSPITALMEGHKLTFHPDALAIEAGNWATKQGKLDPTITNMMQASGEGSSISFSRKAMEKLRLAPGWMEHEMVRLPSFLMYENALRESIPNKEARFSKAAEMMDDRVVNYHPSNMPLMYNDMGIVGRALRPLKQYPHNIWGQFLDYASYAKDGGSIKPMAYFLGTNLSLAGLKGLAFLPEVTAMVLLYNYMFNQDVPTPEHLMLTSGVHDALVYGGLSTVLGHDISASVAHPSIPIPLTSAPIAVAGNIVADSAKFMYKWATGTVTEADTMNMWMALSPNVLHGWIENLYTNAGGYVPNPNENMAGIYKRTDSEKWWTSFVGMRSIDEAKERAFIRGVKQLLIQDASQKLEATDAIVDRVKNGKEVSPELYKKYIEEGGSASRLKSAVEKSMKNEHISPEERLMGTGQAVTPERAHKIERLRERLQPEKPQSYKEVPYTEVPYKEEESLGPRKIAIMEGEVKREYADQKYNFPIGRSGSRGTYDDMPRVGTNPKGSMVANRRRGYNLGRTEI